MVLVASVAPVAPVASEGARASTEHQSTPWQCRSDDKDVQGQVYLRIRSTVYWYNWEAMRGGRCLSCTLRMMLGKAGEGGRGFL